MQQCSRVIFSCRLQKSWSRLIPTSYTTTWGSWQPLRVCTHVLSHIISLFSARKQSYHAMKTTGTQCCINTLTELEELGAACNSSPLFLASLQFSLLYVFSTAEPFRAAWYIPEEKNTPAGKKKEKKRGKSKLVPPRTRRSTCCQSAAEEFLQGGSDCWEEDERWGEPLRGSGCSRQWGHFNCWCYWST